MAVNHAPVLTNVGVSPTSATGGTPVLLDPTATVSDADLDAFNGGAGDYNGASVTISRSGGANANDVFGFDTTGASFRDAGSHVLASISGFFASYAISQGSITITFADVTTIATTALVNDVLRHITYDDVSGASSESVTIHYDFNDGNAGGQGSGGALHGTGDQVVDVGPAAPIDTVPAGYSVNSNTSMALQGLAVGPPGVTSMTTTLHVDHGTLVVAAVNGVGVTGSGTGTVTLNGTSTQIDGLLTDPQNNVIYHSAFNFSGTDHLTMTSNDGASDTAAAPISVSSTGITTAGFDFNFDNNGDGHSDILLQDATTGGVSIWESGQPAQATTIAPSMPSSWHLVGVGDFDDNHSSDLLWQNDNGSVAIWDNGVIGHTIATGIPSTWHVAGVGDFDGNGHSDILWRNDNGSVAVWDNGVTGHAIAGPGTVSANMNVVGIGDFNGNGKSDILWQDYSNGALTIWTDGQSTQATTVATSLPSDWHVAGVGDFDGNGHSDILLQNVNGTVAVLDNGVTGHNIATGVPSSWHIDGVGDFNADGKSDILWHNDNGSVAIWDSGVVGHTVAGPGGVPTDFHIVA